MQKQRLVFYISNELRQEIELFVDNCGISLAAFSKAAVDSYLKYKRREERRRQLEETCKRLNQNN